MRDTDRLLTVAPALLSSLQGRLEGVPRNDRALVNLQFNLHQSPLRGLEVVAGEADGRPAAAATATATTATATAATAATTAMLVLLPAACRQLVQITGTGGGVGLAGSQSNGLAS